MESKSLKNDLESMKTGTKQEDFKKINDLLLSITEGHNYSNNAIQNRMTMEDLKIIKKNL